jgi:RNA polymerase sigma-70 factor (ECF subfamily)
VRGGGPRQGGSLRSYAGLAPFRLWLLGIARHTCTDHLRRKARGRRLVVKLLSAPAETAPDPTSAAGARDALAALDADRRAAFVLPQLIGLSYDEAAQACDVPVGTIRSRVARAREQLLTEHRSAVAR